MKIILFKLLLLNSTGYLDSSIDKALSVLFQKDKTNIKKVLQHKNIKNQTVLELLIRQGRSDLALSLIENHQLDLTHPNHSSQYLVLSCRSLGTTKKPEKDYKLLSLFLDHILSNKIAISLEAFDIIKNQIRQFSSYQVEQEINNNPELFSAASSVFVNSKNQSEVATLITKSEYKKPILIL